MTDFDCLEVILGWNGWAGFSAQRETRERRAGDAATGSQGGALVFLVALDLIAAAGRRRVVGLALQSATRLNSSWMLPSTALLTTCAPPPCTTWTEPPTRDLLRMATLLAPSPWALPITTTLVTTSVAARSTLNVHWTWVPWRRQVVPYGTRTLSRVTAPMLPRQTLSSALAGATASAAEQLGSWTDMPSASVASGRRVERCHDPTRARLERG